MFSNCPVACWNLNPKSSFLYSSTLAKTKKPLEVRMGSGKGSPEEWVAVVKTGRVLFEVAGLDEATLREALRLASHKLPIKCKIIGKGE